jgi:hypothetical protein
VIAATVVIPTFDHGPTLRLSVASVLAQTVTDLEVFVIGDGAPDETRAIVAELAARDPRVRFFDHPKGPRHGEIYRHQALAEARGRIVAYLGDDDLMLPDHVASMGRLLERADLANALPVHIAPDDSVWVDAIDLGVARWRDAVRAGYGFSLSCGAHTLEAYRRLPHGWRTTPSGIPTDAYFWQQVAADPACRLASGHRPTVLHFWSGNRRGFSIADRVAELERWTARLAEPGGRAELDQRVMAALFALASDPPALRQVEGSTTWRLRRRVLSQPTLARLLRSLATRAAGRPAR